MVKDKQDNANTVETYPHCVQNIQILRHFGFVICDSKKLDLFMVFHI